LHIREFLGQHLKLIFASFVSMFPLYLIANYWHGINESSPLSIRALELLIFIILGAIGYFVVAQRMKVAEIAVIMEYFPGRKRLKKDTSENS
jgi:hypothetical protein